MAPTEIYVSADMLCSGVEIRAADDPERRLVMTPSAELGFSNKLSWLSVLANCGLPKNESW